MGDGTETGKPVKPAIDWEGVEREYRAGQLSVLQIAKMHGISHTAIQKRAKAGWWTRDLSEKVRKEVAARLVATQVAAPSPSETREAVETAAARGVSLVLSHRTDISSNRSAVTKLIAELHSTIECIDDIEAEIEIETENDRDGKRRARMMAAVALPSRAAIANSLANALKTLIPLERQAFNLDNPDKDKPGDTVTAELTDTSLAKLSRLLE